MKTARFQRQWVDEQKAIVTASVFDKPMAAQNLLIYNKKKKNKCI